MTKFIGAEYVIANMLIKKMENGETSVSLAELSRCGIEVQRISIKEEIDAIFLTSRSEIFHAIYDFTDYFQCQYDEDDQISGITINADKEIMDLQERFVGFIPKTIVDVLLRAIDIIAA